MFEIVINDRFKPRRISHFNDFNLTLKLDSIASTFGFSWLFNPNDKEHKNAICPSHFHECQIYYDNELLLNGNLINFQFGHGALREVAQIGGYSKTGVLQDSNVPISAYPIQTIGRSIEGVAKSLCSIFGIKVVIDSSVQSKMQSVVMEDDIQPTDTIGSYLKKISEVKGIIMIHNENGDLVFTSVDTSKKPIFKLDSETGSTPITNVSISINGQNMHRNITVVQQADSEGGVGGQHTIRNPYVVGSYIKDKTIKATSGIQDDMPTLARRELANELKNIKLSADSSTWEINDEIIKPGDIITVNDPNLYIYKDAKFVIDSVSYTGSNSEIVCSFTAVPIEVYENGKVKSMYEGINIHDDKYN